MAQPITTAADITDQLVSYLAQETLDLTQRDEFAIQNYADREIFNPEMQEYLAADAAMAMLGADDQEPHLAAAMPSQGDSQTALRLNLAQGMEFAAFNFPDWLRPRFRKLKKLVYRAGCTVARALTDDNAKTIIKTVLIALIPAFASGIPALVFPIVIGFVAYLLKYGIEQACPV